MDNIASQAFSTYFQLYGHVMFKNTSVLGLLANSVELTNQPRTGITVLAKILFPRIAFQFRTWIHLNTTKKTCSISKEGLDLRNTTIVLFTTLTIPQSVLHQSVVQVIVIRSENITGAHIYQAFRFRSITV